MRFVSFIQEQEAKKMTQDEVLKQEGKLGIELEGSKVIPAESLNKKLVTFDDLVELWVTDVSKELKDQVDSLSEEQINELSLDLNDLRLLSPIPHPRQDVLCLGLNYKAHAEESMKAKGLIKDGDGKSPYPEKPIYFAKRADVILGPGMEIPSHSNYTSKLDYEVELAVIIGKDAFDLSEDEVMDTVLGYTVFNDISARDLQTERGQWYLGKSLRGHSAMGPAVVSGDEVDGPLQVQTYLNGELMQDAKTDDLIFDIPTILTEVSKTFGLKKGTIIVTGTPAGVIMGLDNPVWLKPGDKVECVIEKIGTLVNIVGE